MRLNVYNLTPICKLCYVKERYHLRHAYEVYVPVELCREKAFYISFVRRLDYVTYVKQQ